MMVTTLSRSGAPLLPLGQFRFEQVGSQPIGAGGLGVVHRIRIIESNWTAMVVGTEWAAKTLNNKWAAHPQIRMRFEREIQALKQMDHPNIITFHGENLPEYSRFYIMPVFEQTLRKYIAGGGLRGQWREIAQLGASLAEALDYAHAKGFIHRDFKPDNVLFNGGGPLIIADWGLGYFVHKESQVLQQLTVGGMGTEYYCSAEQWATGKCDCRGDIYSLGMTLDEWVTGRQRPITVGAGLGAAASSGSRDAGGARFDTLLRQMTQFARGARPASMRIVAAELRAAAR